MSVGLLESFELIEGYGGSAVRAGILDMADLLVAVKARQRFGCKSIPNSMSSEEKMKVMEVGSKLKAWRA